MISTSPPSYLMKKKSCTSHNNRWFRSSPVGKRANWKRSTCDYSYNRDFPSDW